MANKTAQFLFKYGVPCLAVIVIAFHIFFVRSANLSKWKGGGYGMYTGIHYWYNQVYIPGMSVDSLIKDNDEVKWACNYLMVMPNEDNLKKVAKLVLKASEKDSIHVQIWKPTVNSKTGVYSRKLINEVHFKNSDL